MKVENDEKMAMRKSWAKGVRVEGDIT